MQNLQTYEKPPCVRIAEAEPSAFFTSGLEYNTPARGMWNIVHMGMRLPEAHQVFVCAQGCLRGVILTAAEMEALDRLSWVAVSESDMFDGSLEQKIIDGTAEILHRLPKLPPVVLLFLSCIHLFAGCDFSAILNELHEQFPDVQFIDCYMTPTMRQTVSPIVRMNEQLYTPLKPCRLNPKSVSIIGCDRSTDEHSELVRLIRENGFTLRDINLCKNFAEYQQLAESVVNITYLPHARSSGELLSDRMGTEHLYIPASFSHETILKNYKELCQILDIDVPDFSAEQQAAEDALLNARQVIGKTPVVIDYTAVTRPFELAKLLHEHGFTVKAIIADSAGEETEAFCWLQTNLPDLLIYGATNVNMLHFHEEPHEKILAIGQKAAYYFAADNFVNFVMNGGYYGFAGIQAIAELMTQAFCIPKDRRTLLRHKAFGCASCLE